MIAKITRGANFLDALRYVIGESNDLDVVGGNVLGQSAKEIVRDFDLTWSLRADIRRPVWHCSLSLAPGEHLEDYEWWEVVDEFMSGMGLSADNYMFTAIRNMDTAHEHVHIVANRIGLNGEVWFGRWEAKRAITLTRALEHRFGLKLVRPSSERASVKHLSRAEQKLKERTGEVPVRSHLQAVVWQAAESASTIESFTDLLHRQDVSVRLRRSSSRSDSAIVGVSFSFKGVSFAGSDLGAAYAWPRLVKRIQSPVAS